MDPVTLAVLAIVAMFVFIAMHVPIGIAMALAGAGGVWIMLGPNTAMGLFSSEPVSILTDSALAAIPMFLLMGNLATAGGLSADLYRLFNAFFGHWRGGLAIATIVGSGGFGAVSGSSLGGAAVFVNVALPEMQKRNYKTTLAIGSIAAGGTLSVLIPPSNIMLLYGILTEQFVITLFAASIIPGIVSILIYCIVVAVVTRIDPAAGPGAERSNRAEKLDAIKSAWAVILLAALVSGGIYGGIFTVTEAAAVGAVVALGITILRGRLTWRAMLKVLKDTAATTGMIFLVMIGAQIFSVLMALTQLPEMMASQIQAFGLPPIMIIIALIIMYIIIGCIFDSIPAMIITLPVVFPLVVGLGYDPVWWGVINLMVIEIGMLTPPIGIIPFILHGMRRDIPLSTIFKGIGPFFMGDLIRLALMVAFPAIVLWLPHQWGLM